MPVGDSMLVNSAVGGPVLAPTVEYMLFVIWDDMLCITTWNLVSYGGAQWSGTLCGRGMYNIV